MSSTPPAARPTLTPPPTPTKTRKLPLRIRWTLSMLLAGAVPLALLGVATLQIQRRGLEHAELQNQRGTADHALLLVDHALRDAAEGTHRVGFIMAEGAIPQDELRLHMAQEMMANSKAIGRVALYGPDGTRIVSIARRDSESVPESPERLPALPSQALGEEGAWLPVEYGPHGVLVRYVEAVTRDGQLRGYVLSTMRLSGIASDLAALSRDRFEDRDDGVLLLDGDGRIFLSGAHPSRGLRVGDSLVGKDLLSVVALRPTDYANTLAYTKQYVANGEELVGTVITAPKFYFPLAIVVRHEAAVVYGSLAHTRRSLLLAGSGFLLLALVLSAVLVARTVTPIQALMRLAVAYGKRRFQTRSEVRSGDEIELLGNQMMDMADAISASEKEIARRQRVESDLARFMPSSVAERIAAGERSIALGGERRRVTILFADVASFTPFAESTEPERVVAFLNELFGLLTEVVFKYEGTVDKFIGDCVMAIFGAPQSQEDHCKRALSAAEDMQRFVDSTAAKWKTRYGIEPKLAIGVSTGEALVGNLGSEARMEYTCVGDVVNLAARLEGIAQPGQVLVTQELVDAAEGDYEFKSLGEHPIRGKKHPVALFELVR